MLCACTALPVPSCSLLQGVRAAGEADDAPLDVDDAIQVRVHDKHHDIVFPGHHHMATLIAMLTCRHSTACLSCAGSIETSVQAILVDMSA